VGTHGLEVLLVHPGGPFWRGKHAGAWQVPKGLVEASESDEAAARREAGEELGVVVDVALTPLGEVRQSGGKLVVAFAGAMDLDPATVRSNRIEIEWPPRSGRRIEIPEVDEACWFTLEAARVAMLASQQPFLDRLPAAIGS
jgi:predicted NUDIX family NTP pyrophosphohydrolase